MKALVIYYDGNQHQVKQVETNYPDSSMPQMYGLGEDDDVIAVISCPGNKFEVFIEEQCVLAGEEA